MIELVIVILVIGILSAIAVTSYDSYRDKVRVATAMLAIKVIANAINSFHIQTDGYPDSLAELGMDTMKDPWGNSYRYLRIAGADKKDDGGKDGGGGKDGDVGQPRKDHFMVPINTDYDLYSKGPDGDSVAPLTAKASRDDIIRANDGKFIGKAEDY